MNNLNNQFLPINQMEFTVSCINIPTAEYKNLINENKELNNTILILRGNEKILQENIENHKKSYDELKLINDKLKEEMEALKIANDTLIITVKKHEQTIEKHEQTIEKHEQTIEGLETKIESLETKMDKRDNKELMNKYYTAIHDFNTDIKLMNKLSGQNLEHLNDIRDIRVSECHYLVSSMRGIKKTNRIIVLQHKLINMPDKIKIKFDKKFPNFRTEILKYFHKNITITQEEEDDINEEYWDNE
jgi:chromosome segregation ATPase